MENAGYKVILAMNVPTVRKACKTGKISLVMIGYLLPSDEKRHVWHEPRKTCKTPILELYAGAKRELMESSALFAHESRTADDFLAAAEQILDQPPSSSETAL